MRDPPGESEILHATSATDLPLTPELAASLDAILVLGGGVPSDLESPPLFVQTRCEVAAEVYRLATTARSKPTTTTKGKKNSSFVRGSGENQGPAILCLSAGTAHAAQLMGGDGLPIWESTASAAYLLRTTNTNPNNPNLSSPPPPPPNIPHERVFVETASYDTISNAYFARTTITDVVGWRNLLIVTNEFHMSRSRTIFDWIFSLDRTRTTSLEEERAQGTSPQFPADDYTLHYLACPDDGLSPEAVRTRTKHEQRGEHNLRTRLIPRIQTLEEAWNFLSHEHDLYTASKLVDRARRSFQTKNDLPGNDREHELLLESYQSAKQTTTKTTTSSPSSPQDRNFQLSPMYHQLILVYSIAITTAFVFMLCGKRTKAVKTV